MVAPSLDDTLRTIRQLVGRGQARSALESARAALATRPNESRLWHALAAVHASMGDIEQATTSVEQALALSPKDPSLLIVCGQLLGSIGQRREAHEVARLAERLAPTSAALQDALGSLFTLCDDPQRALTLFRAAVNAEPGNVRYLYNLATAQRMVGAFDAAEVTLDETLRLEPGNAEAHLMRSDLRRQTPQRNHLSVLSHLIETPSTRASDRVLLGYALAKELEDVGEFGRSFAYLSRASEAHRGTFGYDVQDDIRTISEIISRHGPHAFTSPCGNPSTAPIFVMGLPRTGTTLLERILASHPDVHGAGELQAFPVAAIKAVRAQSGTRASKLEFVDLALGLDGMALGDAYLRSAIDPSNDRPFFVDKQPMNYLYAGLIHHALPRASLIIVTRDAMDACFAMYRTLFTGAYPFSYRQEELGLYYLAWARLVDHWQSVLEERVLVVRYEDLVMHTESTIRRVLVHCGLPWSEQCLRFHDNPAAVTTASAVTARQPIFSSSIGRWRHFESHLTPLRRIVSPGHAGDTGDHG